MKLLITSDIHGKLDRLERVLLKHPDMDAHINAGDMCLSLHQFESNAISVKGNNDYFLDLPYQRLLEYGDLRILLTHGHQERVKMGLKNLIVKAKAHQANMCVFGHTHKSFMEEIDGILFINPGALGDYHESYAIYDHGTVTFHTL